MDFTYSSYNELIKLIRENDYTITGFDSWKTQKRAVILRHDVDYDPDKALEFAEFEHSIGVASTYFVLITSPLYNSLSRHVREIFRRIQSLGHFIGLHYDETCYPSNDDIEANVETERRILEGMIGRGVNVFSMHRPSREILDRDLYIDGMINCYSSEYFNHVKYISDSRRDWREPAEMIVSEGKHDKIQILTHPFWYNESSVDIHDSVSGFVNRGSMKRYTDMSENITDIAGIMDAGEVR